MKKKGQITRRISPFALALGVCLVLYAVSLLLPLLWAFMTSFKLQSDFRLNVLGFPDPPAWNYSFVLSQFKIPVTTEAGITESGYIESEGVKIRRGKLFLGFASQSKKDGNRRRANIFQYELP